VVPLPYAAAILCRTLADQWREFWKKRRIYLFAKPPPWDGMGWNTTPSPPPSRALKCPALACLACWSAMPSPWP